MSGPTLVGRVWRPGIGPALVQIVNGRVLDKTSRIAPTMFDLLELQDPMRHLAEVAGDNLGSLEELLTSSHPASGTDSYRLLAPCDFQAVKAAGVTFAGSMVERVIEERAAGDPERANAIRAKVAGMLGGSLRKLVPGSEEASHVKATLIAEGLWSQYLEVGIGPDAEVFTKCPPMAAVPPGEVEAARACGMSGLLLRRRIVWPIALRHGLPIYGSEAILMVKATSLTSIITLTEITGIAHKLIASTYRVVEIFVAAGAIYLAMTFLLTLVIGLAERRLNAHLTHR